MMDKRLKLIQTRLSEYALGKFHIRPLAISEALDEVDAIMTGINILGEELQAVTISKNYFNDIYNSVSDMVFVCNRKGKIIDANRSACQQLGTAKDELQQTDIGKLLNTKFPNSVEITAFIKNKISCFPEEATILCKDSRHIPISLKVSVFTNERGESLLLFTAADISYRQKAENLIIRAIIDTQEMERQRLAKDIHDGLAQQLSGIKFCLSTTAEKLRSGENKDVLLKATAAANEMMTDMRNICFSLMPKTLSESGLVLATLEFCNIFLKPTGIRYHVEGKALPHIPSNIEIDLYRIVQEFISNTVKHADADLLSVRFFALHNSLVLEYKDNGKGFNPNSNKDGMGLHNVSSRVKSHNGNMELKTSADKGSSYRIQLPHLTLSNDNG